MLFRSKILRSVVNTEKYCKMSDDGWNAVGPSLPLPLNRLSRGRTSRARPSLHIPNRPNQTESLPLCFHEDGGASVLTALRFQVESQGAPPRRLHQILASHKFDSCADMKFERLVLPSTSFITRPFSSANHLLDFHLASSPGIRCRQLSKREVGRAHV